MPNPTVTVSPPAARPLADILEAVRWVTCGHCNEVPGLPCAMHPVTRAVGCHAARFAMAFRCDLISGADLIAALDSVLTFTNATVIFDAPAGGAA